MIGLRGLTKIHVMNAGDGLSIDSIKHLMNTFNSRQTLSPFFIFVDDTALVFDIKDEKAVGLVTTLELDNNGKLYAHVLLSKRYHNAELYPVILPTITGDLSALLLFDGPIYKNIDTIKKQQTHKA